MTVICSPGFSRVRSLDEGFVKKILVFSIEILKFQFCYFQYCLKDRILKVIFGQLALQVTIPIVSNYLALSLYRAQRKVF